MIQVQQLVLTYITVRAELENEKMEKQFMFDELAAVREAKEKIYNELLVLKQESRERSAASDLDMSKSTSDSDLSERFHSLMEEKKDNDKYLDSVEKQHP